MNHLFLLIKSLSSHEKRHFKLYAQRTSSGAKNNIYLLLFDAIDSFEEYNEEALLKKHRNAPFIKHFATHKNYLYDAILKAMREYSEENILVWQIRGNYYKIRILASKGLDKPCLKLIEKTKPLAWQYEQYSTLNDIIDLQLYLFGNCRVGAFDPAYLAELTDERNRLFAVMNDYRYIHNNWHIINVLFQNMNKEPIDIVIQKATEIINQPEMRRMRTADEGLLLRTRYLACLELYYKSIGDAENCYKYSKLIVEHRCAVEAQQPNTYTDPMAIYFNFMVACYNYEKWAEMETYLLLMKNFPCKTIEQQIRQFHNYLYGGLMLYLATKNYANARQLIAEYQIGKTKYNTQVRLDFTIFIESLCGLTAFFEGQSDEALAWWTSIIEQTKHTTELRTQGAVRIYRLLLWAQQNEWRLLESELRNARRFLQKTNLLTAREELLFKTIDANLQQKTALYIPNLINALSDIKQPIISETTVFNRFMLDMLDS